MIKRKSCNFINAKDGAKDDIYYEVVRGEIGDFYKKKSDKEV